MSGMILNKHPVNLLPRFSFLIASGVLFLTFSPPSPSRDFHQYTFPTVGFLLEKTNDLVAAGSRLRIHLFFRFPW